METPVISFIPPIVGADGEFNTVRLGGALAKRLAPGMKVLLMNQKTQTVFGEAVVTDIAVGTLKQLCLLHGHKNHTELSAEDADQSGDRLFKLMQKIYGPHIATETKKATVVYLRRIHEQP